MNSAVNYNLEICNHHYKLIRQARDSTLSEKIFINNKILITRINQNDPKSFFFMLAAKSVVKLT